MNSLGVIFIGLFFLGVFYFCFVSARTILFISRQGCGMPFKFSAVPGWAIKHYVSWCEKNGVEVNHPCLDNYQLATKILLSAIVVLLMGLVLVTL